jgi:hypothetical protein
MDVAGQNPADSLERRSASRSVARLRLLHLTALVLGVVAALLFSAQTREGSLWGKRVSSVSSSPSAFDSSPYQRRVGSVATISASELDRESPQQQAEILLQGAITGANDAGEIQQRLDGWRGKLKWDAQLGQLTSVALTSSNSQVRDAAVEVQLAAYGLSKRAATVDSLIRQSGSSNPTRAAWALWSLGLLANRGVETGRVVEILSQQLRSESGPKKVSSEDARRWAIAGLALAGTDASIAPLLDAMRSDPSALVRERAAAILAQAGLFTHEQRWRAVPQLINVSDDSALDPQVRTLAFQALGDITQQRLPNNAAAWRQWYQQHAEN